MKLSYLYAASLLCLGVGAAKSKAGKFHNYHTRALSSSPLELDDGSYDELISGPRDYSAVVLLTASEARYGCKVCKEFAPEWDLLAKSWNKGDRKGESRTLFGTLDFSKGKNTFQKMMLQTAPVLLLFPPTIGPGAKIDTQPVRFNFQASQSAEQIHSWVSRHLPEGPRPPLKRPFNYMGLLTTTTILLGVITFVTLAKPYVLPIIQNRNIWAGISLICILLFTSGHMYNHIRKVPYVSGDGKGGISYFAGGFSNQYGMETQIVAAMYGILSFATIALALKVPRMADPKSQQVAVIIWASVIWGMYSFLLGVFRQKNGGYPFYFPPFRPFRDQKAIVVG